MGASLSLSVNRVPGSENVSANASQVDVLMQVSVSGNTYNQAMDDYGSITIDGTEISIGAVSVPQYSTVTLYSARHTVTHNADGTKTVQVSGAYNINTSSYQWLYASASVMCNTIPRATTPTIGAVTLGSAVTIGLPRASDSFTHNLSYTFGNATGTIATGAGESCTWTPPITLASQIPNAVSGTGTIICDTYSGSTLIGSKSISFAASVPASVVPTIGTCAASPVNANAWINGKGIYVVGYTKARVQTSAAGAYGSTIRSVAISLDGRSYTGEDITSELLQTAGSLTASITATDTRGRTASATRPITVQPYASPAISGLAYQRGSYSGGAWTSNDNGEDIKVTFTMGLSLTAYSNAGAITASCTGEDNQTASGAGAGAKTYYFTTIGVDNTRTVTVSVTDSVGVTGSKSMTVATVEVPLNIDAPNNRIAIGGIAEKDKTLQVKWPAELTAGLTVTGAITGSDGISGAYVHATANGNTVTIGSQNEAACHFMNSANRPFYFNRDTVIDGNIYTWSTARSCGTPASPWANTYTKALTINGSAVADFVVGSGWSGSWFYHIYKSNFCEAWCYIHLTNVAITNAWGYLFESALYRPPENLALNFSDMRRITIECAGADTGILGVEVSGWEGANYPAYYLTSANSKTVANVYLVAHASGYSVVP